MPTQAQAVELTKRYQRKLGAVTAATAAALERLWDELGSWDEADVAEFIRLATPAAAAAQRTATALTGGYLGLLLNDKPPAVDAAQFLDLLDLQAPFLAYWHALSVGQKWEDAITSGRTASGSLGSAAVQTAARGSSAEVDQQEERLTGWERILVGPSCEYCATVATQRYHTAETAGAPGHDRCDCTVVPIVGKLNPGRVINRDLLDTLKNRDEPTAYVNPDGSPAARPDAAPVEAP